MHRILCLAALFALAGCSGTGPAEPLTDLQVSNETWLVITDAGAGPVSASTPYDQKVLAGVAAGAEIRPIETAREQSTTNTHAAFINDVQAVQFFRGPGGTVEEMHGVTQHLAGPNGERIGMTMAQAGIRRGDCRNGEALWRGMAVCRARGAEHVQLVFSIPQYDGPFETLASEEDLRRAELQRIVWRAKS